MARSGPPAVAASSAEDEIRYICPRCVAATTGRGERAWTRIRPRP